MDMKKRILSVAAVVLCTAAAVLYGADILEVGGQPQDIRERQNLFVPKKETIYFWYTDEDLTSFLNGAAVSFGEKKGVRVIPVLTSDGEYLEAINQASLHTEQVPDVYLIDSSNLEKAYLAGLASETKDAGSVCNTENFPQAALYASSYQGKNIAYPFYFDTSVLLYNKTYLDQWGEQQNAKRVEQEESTQQDLEENASLSVEMQERLQNADYATLDELLYVANSFDVPEQVEGVMKWDVADIFYNYWFVGRYLIVGGTSGDDRSRIDIDNPETTQCLKTYQLLNQFFSMETDTITYESVLEDFADGKILFTVVTSDAAKYMQKMVKDGRFAYEYGFAVMPDVSEDLDSASLSVTNCAVVNGYSASKKLANEFAAYLVCDYAEELYERTGKMPVKLQTDIDHEEVQIFRREYADSVSLPKMMETGNFWMQMEVLFSKVWNGEDVETLVNGLAARIRMQVTQE